MKYPKVLIISHNALSLTNNMGKTLVSYFSSFPKECIAQLYLHEGMPNSNTCSNYYCFDDKDALYSIFNKSVKGKIYKGIFFDENSSSVCTGRLYSVGKKKKPVIYFLRDILWAFSNVKNDQLIEWIKEFNPDIFFFASGDYGFSYRIASSLSKYFNVPLATCCFDDYYLNCTYLHDFLGKTYHRYFMKNVRKIMNQSKALFAINNYMANEYEKIFKRKFSVLYNSTSINFNPIPYDQKKGICYIGGLSLNREQSLLAISRMLKNKKIKKTDCIVDVYSEECRDNIIQLLSEENGIFFHGSATPTEVTEIIKQSLAVIHVEAFDNSSRKRTKLSLSTKIAESLGSGTVLIAYGPREIASMRYLEENGVAIYSDDINELEKKISNYLNDEIQYNYLVKKSLQLAKTNHSIESVQSSILVELCKAIKS